MSASVILSVADATPATAAPLMEGNGPSSRDAVLFSALIDAATASVPEGGAARFASGAASADGSALPRPPSAATPAMASVAQDAVPEAVMPMPEPLMPSHQPGAAVQLMGARAAQLPADPSISLPDQAARQVPGEPAETPAEDDASLEALAATEGNAAEALADLTMPDMPHRPPPVITPAPQAAAGAQTQAQIAPSPAAGIPHDARSKAGVRLAPDDGRATLSRTLPVPPSVPTDDRIAVPTLASQSLTAPTCMQASGNDASALPAPLLTQTMLPVTSRHSASPYPPQVEAANHAPVVQAQPGRIGADIGVEIARAVKGEQDDLLIRLDPREMGRIDVRLSFEKDGILRAVMSADSPAALEMLRRESSDLHRALTDAGVRSDGQSLRFDARSGEGMGQGGQRWQQDRTHGGRPPADHGGGEGAAPQYRPLRGSGQIDLIA